MNFFAPLIGQPQAVELLNQAVVQNRIAPAYLFAGVDGIGRSLAAQCFVERVFCQNPTSEHSSIQKRLRLGTHPDVLWIQPTYLYQGQLYSATEAAEKKLKRKAPPIIRTEQIRKIAQFLSRRSAESPRSMVVIEKAETMAESAANALLKTLEEPGQATIILIAPSAESILPTLVSRCQKIPFYRLSPEALAQVLNQTGHEAILLQNPAILAACQGSPGNAIFAGQICRDLPPQLLPALEKLPKSSLSNALELARQVGKLELEVQLWLLDYLQQQYWQQFLAGKISPPPLAQLEIARKYLLSFVQPRLVWEVALMEFSAIT